MSLVESQEGMTDLIPCNDQCGGNYEHYTYTQGEKEVTVIVPLPPGTTSKSIKVEIQTNFLSITIPAKGTVLSGTLYKPIKAEDSTWCIEDKKELAVTLVKTNMKYEEWWPHVVQGERQIDMKTLRPPEIHMRDLDDGAKATMLRMMEEQRQKQANGL